MNKEDFNKFHKLMGIFGEMYFQSPKYFTDCFFDMYYQFKKKMAVEELCYGDEDLIKRTWGALNYFKKLVKEDKKPQPEAFDAACKFYKVDPDKIQSVIRSFNGFKGAKKTKFKDLF